jgi:hypothetical protein
VRILVEQGKMMDQLTVDSVAAEKLRRFPKRVYLCDEQGKAEWYIERVDSPETLPDEQTLAVPAIEQAIREIFAKI